MFTTKSLVENFTKINKTYQKIISFHYEKRIHNLYTSDYEIEVQQHLEYIIRILTYTYKINQLILHEKNEKKLLYKSCFLLTENGGFENVWIALHKDNKLGKSFFHNSKKSKISPIENFHPAENLPYCIEQSCKKTGLHIMDELHRKCLDCPQKKSHEGRSVLTTNLTHNNHLYGFISCSIKSNIIHNEEFQIHFSNLADTIARALWFIKTKKQYSISQKTYNKLNFEDVRD